MGDPNKPLGRGMNMNDDSMELDMKVKVTDIKLYQNRSLAGIKEGFETLLATEDVYTKLLYVIFIIKAFKADDNFKEILEFIKTTLSTPENIEAINIFKNNTSNSDDLSRLRELIGVISEPLSDEGLLIISYILDILS